MDVDQWGIESEKFVNTSEQMLFTSLLVIYVHTHNA